MMTLSLLMHESDSLDDADRQTEKQKSYKKDKERYKYNNNA
jgi:hypothetical protein